MNQNYFFEESRISSLASDPSLIALDEPATLVEVLRAAIALGEPNGYAQLAQLRKDYTSAELSEAADHLDKAERSIVKTWVVRQNAVAEKSLISGLLNNLTNAVKAEIPRGYVQLAKLRDCYQEDELKKAISLLPDSDRLKLQKWLEWQKANPTAEVARVRCLQGIPQEFEQNRDKFSREELNTAFDEMECLEKHHQLRLGRTFWVSVKDAIITIVNGSSAPINFLTSDELYYAEDAHLALDPSQWVKGTLLRVEKPLLSRHGLIGSFVGWKNTPDFPPVAYVKFPNGTGKYNPEYLVPLNPNCEAAKTYYAITLTTLVAQPHLSYEMVKEATLGLTEENEHTVYMQLTTGVRSRLKQVKHEWERCEQTV